METPKPRRPSPALVVAVVALVAALAGSAEAALKIGSKQLKKNAVTATKIKNGAVTTRKIKKGAVTASRIANSAVTQAQLAPGERSEAYTVNRAATIALPASAATPVVSVTLPAGSRYVVSATASFGNSGAAQNLVACFLRDDGAETTRGDAALAPIPVYSQTVTLTGVSDGGVVSLACEPSTNAVARNRVITATKVGTVRTQ
jgi:hypothetical protein